MRCRYHPQFELSCKQIPSAGSAGSFPRLVTPRILLQYCFSCADKSYHAESRAKVPSPFRLGRRGGVSLIACHGYTPKIHKRKDVKQRIAPKILCLHPEAGDQGRRDREPIKRCSTYQPIAVVTAQLLGRCTDQVGPVQAPVRSKDIIPPVILNQHTGTAEMMVLIALSSRKS